MGSSGSQAANNVKDWLRFRHRERATDPFLTVTPIRSFLSLYMLWQFGNRVHACLHFFSLFATLAQDRKYLLP
jgi:hypothetical protein